MHSLIKFRVIEEFCKGIVVVEEALRYIYALNGQWFYLSIGNPDAELRCLKDDLENDTIQYNEPPDLDVLLGKDWDDEQEDGPSIEL